MAIIKYELTESFQVSKKEFGSFLADLVLQRTSEDGISRVVNPTKYAEHKMYDPLDFTPHDMMTIYGVFAALDIVDDNSAVCIMEGNWRYLAEQGPHKLDSQQPEYSLYVPDWDDPEKINVYAVLQWVPESDLRS